MEKMFLFVVNFALCSTSCLFAIPIYSDDLNNLGIEDFSDPNAPVPMVGGREIEMSFRPKAGWNQVSARIHISKTLEDLDLAGRRQDREVAVAPAAGGLLSASHILDWIKPVDRDVTTTQPENFTGGDTVYYRWVIDYVTNSGAPRRATGSAHQFTVPRKITIAILGDSYGSGEGAPVKKHGENPWQLVNDGVRAHRSKISGQELAIKEYFERHPHLAYDYVNLSSSGAIASDLYSSVSQYEREWRNLVNFEGDSVEDAKAEAQGVRFSQIDHLNVWLNTHGYEQLDAVIMSIGGNDLGFSTILKNYLGVDSDEIFDAALKGFQDPACIAGASALTLIFQPGAAAAFYLGCSLQDIFNEIQQYADKDTSFRDPYRAKNITNSFRQFSWYESRLQSEYASLAGRLNFGLTSGGQRVSPKNVLATEYPFPMKDCNEFSELAPLIALGFDQTFFGFNTDSIPLISYIFDNRKIGFDLTAIAPITVGFSEEETREAAVELVPPGFTPRPSYGGVNHLIRDHVTNSGAFSPTEWHFVNTSASLPSRTGVCFAGTHFNTITTALNQAGPNLVNNAYHPNQRGHRETYAPAILADLEAVLTDTALAGFASDEGFQPAAGLLPDLVTSFFPHTLVYDQESGQFEVELLVENIGNTASPASATVGISLTGETNATLAPVRIPSIPANASFRVAVKRSVPIEMIREDFPFACPNADDFTGFESYADKDLALRYFLTEVFRRSEITFTADLDENVAELNEGNNKSRGLRVTPPFADEESLRLLGQTILMELSSLLGREVPFFETDLLFDEPAVREYFGYYSPELDSGSGDNRTKMEIAIQKRAQKCLNRNFPSLAVEDEIFLPRDGLRPICLFDEPLLDQDKCLIPANVLVRDETDHLRDFQQIALEVTPKNGRLIQVSVPLKPILADILGKEKIDIMLGGPELMGGLVEPGIGAQISSRTPNISVDVKDEQIMAVQLGTQPGGFDLMPSTIVSEQTSVSAPDVPQDGRTVHATVIALTDSGTITDNYTFSTIARNALLTGPDADTLLGIEGATLTWDLPDPEAAGEVKNFSLSIGSFPGTSDIHPGLADRSAAARASAGGGACTLHSPAILSPEQTSFQIPNLPEDGRKIYITLGTLRDGEWQYEIHQREVESARDSGLRLPRIDQLISARERFVIAPGRRPATFYNLFIGDSPGGKEILNRQKIAAGETETPIDVIFENVPRADDEFRPLPYYVTLETDTPQGIFTDTYTLIPRLAATLIEPVEAETIDISTPVNIRWGPGLDAIGYRLTVHVPSKMDGPIIDEQFGADMLSTKIDLSSFSDLGVSIFIETLRNNGETQLNQTTGGVFLLAQPVLRTYENDAIDDQWQLSRFGIGNPDGLPKADPDGDGNSNMTEFLAGTDPLDAEDFLTTSFSGVFKTGTASVDLPVSNERTNYQLQFSSNLRAWGPLGLPLMGLPGGAPLSVPIPPSNKDKLFYRLELKPK